MFTGIINGLGEISAIARQGQELRFSISPQFAMANLVDGESIAINGVCLSVEKHIENSFWVYASGETLSKTNLGLLRQSDKVNLERAVAVGDRMGGHLVSGHVDCLATLVKRVKAGQSVGLRLNFPEIYAAEVIDKGSVALNGISLTINKCGNNFLEVNIIPDSQKRTNINSWQIGWQINMETDLIGKYVNRAVSLMQGNRNVISRELLMRNGFM